MISRFLAVQEIPLQATVPSTATDMPLSHHGHAYLTLSVKNTITKDCPYRLNRAFSSSIEQPASYATAYS